jgi:glycosyltransferase involved in cell wall biosynthesis
MLVSPHVGGGAKLAMEIHRVATAVHGPVSQLLLPGEGEAERIARSESFPYTRYCLERLTGSSRLGSLTENWRLSRRVRRCGAGVIHVHAPFVYGAAKLFFQLSKLKTILHVHLDFTAEQLRWALRYLPDRIIVCADFMRPAVEEAVGDRPGASERIQVIRNAVDTERFTPEGRAEQKRRFELDPSVPLLIVNANLSPHKGQDTAIRAVSILKQRGIRVQLWIVGNERSGSGEYLAQLKKLVGEESVEDRVSFLGFRHDIPDLLRAADFMLLPSTSEGLPISVLEAQASKCLVLAAPTAGVPEVISHEETGFLIAAHDAPGYAATISMLMNDGSRTSAITEAAYRQVIKHHQLRSYCLRVLDLYESLMRGESSR